MDSTGNRRPRPPTDESRGGYFAVDRRAWAKVCQHGMNAAVAYLVLARGTGGDNRTTKWSTHAVESYTGISRSRAKAAIAELLRCQAITLDARSKPAHPRYRITPAYEMPGCEGHRPPPLASDQQRVFDRLLADVWTLVPKGNPWGKPESWEVFAPRKLADELVQLGRALRHADGERYRAIRHDEIAAAKPDWIWLPNALVDGAAGETAPGELIRQTGSVETLRLFVELYRAHNLDENGGLHFRQIRQDYQRHKVGEWGPFVVWGFATDLVKAWPDAPFVATHLTSERDEKGKQGGWTEFWTRWHRLHALGLVEYVAHLVDADTQQGELMHPMALPNTGLEVERELFRATDLVARTMITPGQLAWANTQRVVALAPVLRHVEGVQMLGIARLRYRPKTKRTQEFLSREVEWRERIARCQKFALHSATT